MKRQASALAAISMKLAVEAGSHPRRPRGPKSPTRRDPTSRAHSRSRRLRCGGGHRLGSPSALISAVVDTNVLVSGFGWARSFPAKVVEAMLSGRFLLVASPPLLGELDAVLRYPKLAAVFPQSEAVVDLIGDIAVLVEPQRRLDLLRDAADNRVLEAALEATADFIVTGDRGLLALERYGTTKVVSPRSSWSIWSRTPEQRRYKVVPSQ